MNPATVIKNISMLVLIFGIWILFFSINVKASGYSDISNGTSVHIYTGTYEVSRDSNGEYKTVVYADTGGSTVVKISNGQDLNNWDKEYVYTDQVGSTAFNLDTSGNVTSEFKDNNDNLNKLRYFAYGSTISSTDISTLPVADTYTGQKKDTELDLMYYKARYYDPTRGRFIQADSVNDGLNRYMYVSGNPTNANDPSGKYSCGDLCSFVTDLKDSTIDIWKDMRLIKNSDVFSVNVNENDTLVKQLIDATDMIRGSIGYHTVAIGAKYSDKQPVQFLAGLAGINDDYTMAGKYLLQYLNGNSDEYTMDSEDIETFSNSVNAISIISDLDEARKYDILMILNYLEPGEIRTISFDEKFSSTPYTNSDEQLKNSLGTLTYKVRGEMSFSLDNDGNPVANLSAEIYSIYDRYSFHTYNYRDTDGKILGQGLYESDAIPYLLETIGASLAYDIVSPDNLSIKINGQDSLFYRK